MNVLAILIFSGSVFINPFNIPSIVTTREIASAITIIELVPAPTQIIIIGPRATFGKLFNITKNGSKTLDKNLDSHKIIAIKKPSIVPDKNPYYSFIKSNSQMFN